ncbi:hypothetical protein ABZU76_45805 [Amycolatopsis sp. NPDC005232]|uniref:hypothetical protein n=1 Tax=Amycolatopsis sp. NPDC005232 TaxID=3157027 RepID=UPI00339E8547
MREDNVRSERVAKIVITVLGGFLVALGVSAAAGLVFLMALAHSNRDFAGSGGMFTTFGLAAAWTILGGAAAIQASRRARTRAIWLTGLPCLTLGAVPAAVVAVDVLFLIPG